MTLILSVNGRESIWMLADRRLSYRGRAPRDDGRKLMFLDTADGVAILGYAGLGATSRGTEPADWMSAVLRGRKLSLEQSLGELAGAAQRQLPKHLSTFPSSMPAGHNIVIPAIVNSEVRLYTIDFAFASDRRTYSFRYTRHVANPVPDRPQRPPRICIAGSGAAHLAQDRRWIRGLLRLVRASDVKDVSPHVVADHLAEINQLAHRNTADSSVGPRCIVAWRHNKSGIHRGGGAHQFYDGIVRATDTAAIPNIGNGMDFQAITKVLMPHVMAQFEAMRTDGAAPELDNTVLNAELAKLPDRPDEDLS